MAGHIPTSGAQDWNTPKWIIECVKELFGGEIDLDPASNCTSIVGAKTEYMLPVNDGLEDSWDFPTIFLNPPFGRTWKRIGSREYIGPKEFKNLSKHDKKLYRGYSIKDWINLCQFAAHKYDSQVVALIPAYVDTKPWQQIIFNKGPDCHLRPVPSRSVCFIKGRIKFELPFSKNLNSAPMACAIIYFGPNDGVFKRIFQNKGYCFCV